MIMEKKRKSIYKELFPVFCITILSFLILTCALTYAYFRYERSGKNPSSLSTAKVNVLFEDYGNPGISQVGAFPVYDEVGRKTEPYTFELKNLGTVEVDYRIKLVPDGVEIESDGCGDNLIADKSLKVQLKKDGKIIFEKPISELEDYELDTGHLGLEEGVNKTESYELRIWIDQSAGAEVMGRHYHGRVDTEIIDSRKTP